MDTAILYPHSLGILPHIRPKIVTASVTNYQTPVTFWVDLACDCQAFRLTYGGNALLGQDISGTIGGDVLLF